MRFFKSIKNKTAVTLLSIFAASTLAAQTTTPATAQPAVSGYNQLAILLIILIFVLAFVIWGMGQVLTALGRQLVDKSKSASKISNIVLLVGFTLLSQVTFAQNTTTAVVEQLPNYGGLTANAYYLFLTVFALELVVIFFLAFSIRRMYLELMPAKIKSKYEVSKLAEWLNKLDQKLFNKAVSV